MPRQAEGFDVAESRFRVGWHIMVNGRFENLLAESCSATGGCCCIDGVRQDFKNLWKLEITVHFRWAHLRFFISNSLCMDSMTWFQCFTCFSEKHRFCALKFLMICSGEYVWSWDLAGWLHYSFGTKGELLTVNTRSSIGPSLLTCHDLSIYWSWCLFGHWWHLRKLFGR